MCSLDMFTFVLLFVPPTVAVIGYTMSHQPDTGARVRLTPSLNFGSNHSARACSLCAALVCGSREAATSPAIFLLGEDLMEQKANHT